MNIVWVTSFAKDMWEASGKDLLRTYTHTNSVGRVFVGLEKVELSELSRYTPLTKITGTEISKSPLLINTLQANKEVIPLHLGGQCKKPECKCKGGPFAPHYKKHQMPCVGHWFNKNFFRWFRKLVTIQSMLATIPDVDIMIWVDSDCVFMRPVTEEVVSSWFDGAGCFYFKSKRPVMEAGIVGYDLRKGGRLLFDDFLLRYTSKTFRLDQRWDDSYQLQLSIKSVADRVKSVDLATTVGDHAAVVDKSVVGQYISHHKGRHGRKLHIMT